MKLHRIKTSFSALLLSFETFVFTGSNILILFLSLSIRESNLWFDRFSDLGLAGQLGLTCAAPAQYAAAAAAASMQAAAASPAPAASLAAAAAAPGKARSSMNLSMLAGRQPVAQQASNPYLQQLYAAAAAPYSPNIMQLMQGVATGNPLLDMYQQQYAAAGYPVTQPQMCPVTQSLSLDASQANAAMADHG